MNGPGDRRTRVPWSRSRVAALSRTLKLVLSMNDRAAHSSLTSPPARTRGVMAPSNSTALDMSTSPTRRKVPSESGSTVKRVIEPSLRFIWRGKQRLTGSVLTRTHPPPPTGRAGSDTWEDRIPRARPGEAYDFVGQARPTTFVGSYRDAASACPSQSTTG